MNKNPSSTATHTEPHNKAAYASRNFWAGFFFGVGLMAFVDEVIFHQLLQWHHFYDLSTLQVGIFTDGLLNSFAWFVAIGSLFMFADLRRRRAIWLKKWIGAVFLGMGVFQLFDGIVNHKVFRVHQVRYQVESILPYDVAWNTAGLLFLLVGLVLLWKTRMPTAK